MMAKLKTKEPPLYMPSVQRIGIKMTKKVWRSAYDGVLSVLRVWLPSSGLMVKVKLRRSAGSGKCVDIVDGSSSSVMSAKHTSNFERKGKRRKLLYLV